MITLYKSDGNRKRTADTLCISNNTLKNHLRHINEKLGTTTTLEAMIKVIKHAYSKNESSTP